MFLKDTKTTFISWDSCTSSKIILQKFVKWNYEGRVEKSSPTKKKAIYVKLGKNWYAILVFIWWSTWCSFFWVITLFSHWNHIIPSGMYFVSQVNDEFMENGWIEMLAHLNKKEKVSIGTVANNGGNVWVFVAFGALFQKVNPERKWISIKKTDQKQRVGHYSFFRLLSICFQDIQASFSNINTH